MSHLGDVDVGTLMSGVVVRTVGRVLIFGSLRFGLSVAERVLRRFWLLSTENHGIG